jgi:glycosyltransferase involved in cell wall biosynthesis
MVGGLGTRVTELATALAESGVRTTLLFVGDPSLPAVQQPARNLEYRRWCQWISDYHPAGVYDGEREKVNDYTASVPPFVVNEIVEPAAARGETVLVIAEDWQTAPCALALEVLLRDRGVRDRVALTWNANNTYGFDAIDWPALASAAQITCVSRYMKFELQARGVESFVIPNGIPQRLLNGAPKKLVRVAERIFTLRRPLYVKVARFEEEKRWMQVIEAFAGVAAEHRRATLVVRGGREPYGDAVFARAREMGLEACDLVIGSRDPREVLEAVATAPGNVINVRSFLPEEALLALYRVADAVLANSGREPFGLVGLEVMAAGGVAVTGSTGEDYVQPFENAIVCDTGDPRELESYLVELIKHGKLAPAIRKDGRATAERYTWPHVLKLMARKLSTTLSP